MDHRLVLTYDISDDKLRTSVHKFLRNYGMNTQKSVFEMIVNDIELRRIVYFLRDRLPNDDGDSVRIYDLCKSCSRNVTKIGEGIDLYQLEYLII